MNPRLFLAFALPALLLCQFRAEAFTTEDIAGTWNFTLTYQGSSPFDISLELGADGSVTIPDSEGEGSGTFTVSEDSDSVTITFDSPSGHAILTGTLNASGEAMAGTIDLDNVTSGTFTADKVVPPTGKLSYRERDTLYVISGSNGKLLFAFYKFTASGSISLKGFPNTDPHTLVLPDDTELNLKFVVHNKGDDLASAPLFGGKLSDASGTAGRNTVFRYVPFGPDTFFDRFPPPAPWRTGAYSGHIVWRLFGPARKPPTLLKFTIVGVARQWATGTGSAGNSQGFSGFLSSALNQGSSERVFPNPDGDTIASQITFGNSSRNVSTAFELNGAFSGTTNAVTPNGSKALRMSRVKAKLHGAQK